MKNAFFVFVFLISLPGFTQTYEYVSFPIGNAIWSESFRTAEFSFPPYVYDYYDKVAMTDEDTTINGHTYKKLYSFNEAVFNVNNSTFLGGIREENKRIYYWGDTLHYSKPSQYIPQQEILLYDFTVNVGDVLDPNLYGYTNFFDITVESIDTILVGNSLRKRISFQFSYTQWIEGIGNIQGLLFPGEGIVIKGQPGGSLICFKQNDTILYFDSNYSDCMPVGVPEINNINGINISIFPNPVNDNLQIEFKENPNESTILIYNLLGQVVSREFLYQMTNEINISNLSKGIYNLRIINENKIANFKIIKE